MDYTFRFKGENITVDGSWKDLFQKNKSELESIESKIGDDFTPDTEKIFRVFKKPIDDIKYVILGQDPYPQKDEKKCCVATGLAFELNKDDWKVVGLNPSLQNIYKSIYFMKNGIVKSISELRDENPKMLPPNRLFIELEKNGVFLLNTSLTCEVGVANSHKGIWNDFIEGVIEKILDEKPAVYWFLWGKKAQDFLPQNIDGIKKTDSCHPRLAKFVKESNLKQITGLDTLAWEK